MDNLVAFYKAYGESIARRLRVIGHGPTKRFVYVEEMASAEEFVSASTNGLKPEMNVLVWERFTEQLSDAGRDSYTSRPMGSLAVIRKPEKDSREARSEAVDICRSAALKVMALMRQDEQDYDGPLAIAGIRFKLEGHDGEPIGPLRGGWVGYGFTFDWLAPLDLELTDDDFVVEQPTE